MSSLRERLMIVIDADVKGAIREIDQLGSRADKASKKAQTGMEKFANSSLKVGTAMVGASVAVGFGLAKTVGAAQEAEQAQIRLANSVKNSSVVGKASIAAFNQQALALQRVTVASDEEVNATQAMLVQFGRTKSEVIKLTPLVVDLSRKMGIDTVSAAKAVGKTLDGNAGALKRMGVSVDETRFSTDRFGATMAALKRAAGGFAEREGKTLTGQLTILRNQFGELEESVGRGVVGVLKDILPAATGAAKGLGEVDDATGGMLGRLATIGTVASGGVGAVLVLAGAVAKVKVAMEDSAVAANAFKGIGVATGAIAGVVGLIGVVDLLKKAFTDTRTAAEKAADAAKLSTSSLAGQFRSAAAESNKLADISIRKLDQLGGASARNAASQIKNIESNRKYLTEFRGLAENNIGTAQRLYNALKKNPEAAQDAGISLSKLAAILKDTAAGQRQANADTERGTRAVQDNARATKESTDSINARRLALLASFDSELGAVQATNDLSKTLKDSNDPLERQAALLAAAGAQAQAAGDKYETMTGKTFTAEQQQQAFRDALIALGTQFPELAGMVNEYLGKLDQIPPSKNTTVTATADTSQIDRLIGKIYSVAGKTFRASLDLFLPGLATGGPAQRGKSYIVGEEGPEIFTPSSSGRILNARDSAAKLSAVGSSGGGNSYYTINVNSLVPTAATGQLIREHLHKAERAGVTTSSVAG